MGLVHPKKKTKLTRVFLPSVFSFFLSSDSFDPVRRSAFFRKVRALSELHALKKALQSNQPIRIGVGSSGVTDEGWYATEIEFLNLLKEIDWKKLFKASSVSAILAEHVWEHLTEEEAVIAAQNCYKYLKPGGYIRVAVPDGLRPDPSYIEWVKPNGIGSGDEHKQLYTYRTLSNVFEKVGFRVELYEYYDEKEEFHFKEWNPQDGMIHRSKRYDHRNQLGEVRYTSIILDGVKLPGWLRASR
jgi:predicted SAM-dependent methyltransferase